MSSRLGPRDTLDPGARRVPIASSLWPDTAEPPAAAARAGRSRGPHPCSTRPRRRWPTMPPAALVRAPRRQVQHPHARQFVLERRATARGAVGARVVGDHDPPREREALAQVPVRAGDPVAERAFCSLYTGDDLHLRGVVLCRLGRRRADGGAVTMRAGPGSGAWRRQASAAAHAAIAAASRALTTRPRC